MSESSAVAASSFVASIGVNTHLDKTWTTYGNAALAEQELSYLGVGTVRDSMAAPTDGALFQQVAAATGVKFDVYLSVSSFGFSQQIQEITANPTLLAAVEGVNEGDTDLAAVTYGQTTGYAAIAAAQQALYAAVTGNAATASLPVIAPSYGNLADVAIAPNTAAYSTNGNTHEYFGTGNLPVSGISKFVAAAQTVSGSQAPIATEAGYYTGASLSNGSADGVDQLVQAKYDLTLLFDDYRLGVGQTFLYELMDEASDPSNTNAQDHYGLFNADGTPKLAATAIHNLIDILADNGTPRTDSFGYQVTGMPSSGESLLMEKSTGAMDIALWNDVSLWNAPAQTETTTAAVPITVNFGQTVESVVEYDPLTGTAAVASWTDVSAVSLTLPDHPVILEVTPFPASQLSLGSFVIPETVAAGQTTGNLWNALVANATESGASLLGTVTITGVGTTANGGTVSFNAATRTVSYTAPSYNPYAPTDSFTYTLTDANGDTVTGTVAISETAPARTSYGIVAGATLTAPATGWTMISLAGHEALYGAAAGGVSFVGTTDTAIYASGTANTIAGGDGNHYVGAGGSGAQVTLGNGNNTIALSGSNNTVVTGNGNNLLWKSLGATTITMGNGNESITAGGAGNIVSIGTGTSTLHIGDDGAAAGNEHVTVAGGANTISLGGANDSLAIGGGTGNQVVSTGGTATIAIAGGSNSLAVQGNGNHVTDTAGANNISTNGNANTITGGAGSDTIWAGGNTNVITAGSGTDSVTLTGTGNTVTGGTGLLTATEYGSGNTFVLPAAGSAAAQLMVNLIGQNDTLDLRTALAATTWDGRSADLGNYLSVQSAGGATTVLVDPDGTGAAGAVAVATLAYSANLSLQNLVAHAILPQPSSVLGLQSATLVQTVAPQASTGNLWSSLVANATESTASLLGTVTIAGVGTTANGGTVSFNAATRAVSYTAPSYNPYAPTDSFTYTLTDQLGDTATGTVAISETAPARTSYGTVVGATLTAPATGWTMISLAGHEALDGTAAGGISFVGTTDTAIYASGTANTIACGDGNHYVGAGGSGAQVTLGNGNNTIALSGSNNTVVTGNGNNLLWKSLGATTITMGNGNESITAGGAGNIVSIGTGTSTLHIGDDGAAAGNEHVTVAGGANTISIGGANDSLAIGGGTGNQVVSTGGTATIAIAGGSNSLAVQGNGNRITDTAGANNISTNGNANTITGGAGSDTIWAGGSNNIITAGSGTESMTLIGSGNTVTGGSGLLTVTEYGSGNTFVLPAAGSTAELLLGNVIGAHDILDLRTTLAGTGWDGSAATLANFLGVQAAGTGSAVYVDTHGTGGAPQGIVVAQLQNVSGLTMTTLLAHAIT